MTRTCTFLPEPGPVRDQRGVTLIETLLVVTITAVVAVPLLGWMMMAFDTKDGTASTNGDTASLSFVTQQFPTDVANALSAGNAPAAADDCEGPYDRDGVTGSSVQRKLVLRSGSGGSKRVVYATATFDGTVELVRRTCVGDGATETRRVASDVSSVSVTCADRPGLTNDPCGRVTLKLTLVAGSSATVQGARRLDPAGGPAAGPPQPVALLTATPNSVARGEPVTFDAGNSTDPDGRPLSYRWDFGDGTISTSVNPSHSYSTLGVKTVAMTVTAEVNGIPGPNNTTFVQIDVVNQAPQVTITMSNPLTVDRNSARTFAATVTDPDSSFGDTIVEYTWDWGDATSNTYTCSPCTTFSQAHTYASSVPVGVKTVTLTAKDSANPSRTASASITVNLENQAPVATITNTKPLNVDRFAAQGFTATASDPDGSITEYTWDWGDGTSDTYTCSPCTNFNQSHTYAKSVSTGTKTVTLTVKDNASPKATTSAVLLVTLRNQSPIVVIGTLPGDVRRGQSRTYSATFSDPDGTVNRYRWSWDDSTSNDVTCGSGCASPNATNHTFASNGTKTITLTVWDNDNLAISTTASVLVKSPTPVATFTASPSSGTGPIGVTFAATDPGSGDTFSWSLGDGLGTTAAGTSTTATIAPGNYSVTLTVSTNDGVSASTTQNLVYAGTPAKVTGLNLVSTWCCTGARLSWTRIPGVAKYKMQATKDAWWSPCSDFNGTATGNVSEADFGGGCLGTPYKFKVQACTAANVCGAWSDELRRTM